jgi:hypothetical protein
MPKGARKLGDRDLTVTGISHQALSSHVLELVIGLGLFPLVIVSHGGSLLFKEGFSTRTLSEFGREPRLLVLKSQLNLGHPRSLVVRFSISSK